MKLCLNYREVYDEGTRSDDYAHPAFKFEWGVTDEEIKRFMTAMNPRYPYYTSSGATIVEVIGKEEIEKHIEIFKKKAEIRKLKEEIVQLS